MQREIITTADGSVSIHLPQWNESYHSKHGAIQEAKHVFIQNGLDLFLNKAVSVLEIGFGTGLNAFITFLEAEKHKQTIDYVGVEAYPISPEEVAALNYVSQLEAASKVAEFELLHNCPWESTVALSERFTLTKRQQFFDQIDDVSRFDLIYFDAFGYRVQPELWSEEIFRRMFVALKPGGILVTYAARSIIKRSMMAAGFSVSKLAGPPGKREMFRANKNF